jgi:hypothetical protein
MRIDRPWHLDDLTEMKGFLRSWKLCHTERESGPDSPWRKSRLKRAWVIIIPGNWVLKSLGVGYRVCGADWAEYETTVFKAIHPDVDAPEIIHPAVIRLPNLEGKPLSQHHGAALANAAIFAFAELGRFHRAGDCMMHGDPHSGNFLHDETAGRCRIIDFETAPLAKACLDRARAFDFAILLLDLVRRDPDLLTPERFREWFAAYGSDEARCPVRVLFATASWRLRLYWWLLGYPAAMKIIEDRNDQKVDCARR